MVTGTFSIYCPISEVHTFVFKKSFQKILSLCIIQERFAIQNGLWGPTYAKQLKKKTITHNLIWILQYSLKSDQIGWKLWNVNNSNIVYTMYEFFCCDNLFAVKSFVFSMSTLIDSCEQFFYCEKIPWDDWSEITPQKCKKETDRQTYREDVMKQKIPERNLIRH